MKLRKLLCLLLVLCLLVLCLAGCRKDKQGTEAAEAEVSEEAAEETAEGTEEQAEEQDEPAGMEVSDEPLIIEIPEGSEIGGD